MSGTSHKSTPETHDAAADAARLVRATSKAALATLDQATGHPYASLVTVALDADAAPILLLSGLARHTRNLEANPRASLLVSPENSPPGDPLALARVTLVGTVIPTASPTARDCFLARHPDAEGYASFADFRFYAMSLLEAHFIGGFGRIVTIPGSDFHAALRAHA